MPYRTRAWLEQHQYALGTSSAQLVSTCELPPPPPPAPPPPPPSDGGPSEAQIEAARLALQPPLQTLFDSACVIYGLN